MNKLISDLAWFATIPGVVVLVCAVWFGLAVGRGRETIE